MDSKKNLKPELKEVYERVMNTKSSARSTIPTPSSQPTAPVTSPPAAPAPPTPPIQSAPESTPAANPEPFLASSAPHEVSDSSGFVFSSHGKKMPHSSPKQEKKDEPKPEIKEKEVIQQQSVKNDGKATQAKDTGKKQSNLLPVLLVLMVIFLGVYALFWAFFFEII